MSRYAPKFSAQMVAPIELVRWPLSFSSETVTSDRASATCYRSLENFRVVAIVVTELEFRDVQRQVLFADLVERADDAALQQRPEAVNGLRVHHAVNVFAARVVHDLMREALAQLAVAFVFIGRDQADLSGYG